MAGRGGASGEATTTRSSGSFNLVSGEKDQRRVSLIDDLVGAEPPQAELQ